MSRKDRRIGAPSAPTPRRPVTIASSRPARNGLAGTMHAYVRITDGERPHRRVTMRKGIARAPGGFAGTTSWVVAWRYSDQVASGPSRNLPRRSSYLAGGNSRHIRLLTGLGVIDRAMPAAIVVVRPNEFIERYITASIGRRPAPRTKKAFCKDRLRTRASENHEDSRHEYRDINVSERLRRAIQGFSGMSSRNVPARRRSVAIFRGDGKSSERL
jgi:hypothetical protein